MVNDVYLIKVEIMRRAGMDDSRNTMGLKITSSEEWCKELWEDFQ